MPKRIKRKHGEIIVGECAEVMRKRILADSVDLIVTSPPYDKIFNYKGYSFDYKAVGEGMLRVLKPGGVAVWIVADQTIDGDRTLTSFQQAIAFQEMGFKVHDVMAYQITNPPMPRSNAYTKCFDFMFVLANGKPKTFNPLMRCNKMSGKMRLRGYSKPVGGGRYNGDKPTGEKCAEQSVRHNIWRYAVGYCSTRDKYAFEHPAMFSEQLAEDHIRSWSNPGDVVLDPMCGSGTVLKMARLLNRRWLGVEISKEYAKIAKRRVSDGQSLFSST